MANREDVEALEALTPWDDAGFRAGLSSVALSVAEASQAFARDARILAALAARVPRCAQDEVGGTPWTSFRQQVAVARQVSNAAAAAELRIALRLTTVLPCTLELLETGQLTVARARVFVTELEVVDDPVAERLDTDLAERVALLAPWRIKDEVRRAVLALDPDAAAVRTAAATAQRDVTLQPMQDGQACVTIIGPAVPLVRWYATLDARARALRAAGDPRNLAALRFDLATSTFPCLTHPPADPSAPPPPSLFGRPARSTLGPTARPRPGAPMRVMARKRVPVPLLPAGVPLPSRGPVPTPGPVPVPLAGGRAGAGPAAGAAASDECRC